MSTKDTSKDSALANARAVMKRLLETPPTPHEAKRDAKQKSAAGKRKRSR
jgi:hypothetical protein